MGNNPSAVRTFLEPARETNVCGEAEVVVVGGGPAGVGAAVAAARNGAETILVERYGHLGGMATGGLVVIFLAMSDGSEEQQIAGLCQEMVDRLDMVNGALYPDRKYLGSDDEALVKQWKDYRSCVREGKLRLNVYVDPELLKCVLNDMVEESGVHLFLHSWGSQAVVDNGVVQGVTFESKSGRQAVMGKIIIDATGDGDIFSSAGAEFDGAVDPELRSSNLGLAFRVCHVDNEVYHRFKETEQKKYADLMGEIKRLGGFNVTMHTSRSDTLWFNNWLPGLSPLNVEDLTWVEVNARKKMLKTHDFFKKHVPGFEESFIMDTASQIGTRGSRRLIGEHIVTEQDIRSGKIHDDSVAVCPSLYHNASPEHPNPYIPYRSLVPRSIENLLAAGRCFSSDMFANDALNLIPHCIAMGEAAGTAAALAVKNGVSPRHVDHRILQAQLIDQGVPLPGVKIQSG